MSKSSNPGRQARKAPDLRWHRLWLRALEPSAAAYRDLLDDVSRSEYTQSIKPLTEWIFFATAAGFMLFWIGTLAMAQIDQRLGWLLMVFGLPAISLLTIGRLHLYIASGQALAGSQSDRDRHRLAFAYAAHQAPLIVLIGLINLANAALTVIFDVPFVPTVVTNLIALYEHILAIIVVQAVYGVPLGRALVITWPVLLVTLARLFVSSVQEYTTLIGP